MGDDTERTGRGYTDQETTEGGGSVTIQGRVYTDERATESGRIGDNTHNTEEKQRLYRSRSHRGGMTGDNTERKGRVYTDQENIAGRDRRRCNGVQ